MRLIFPALHNKKNDRLNLTPYFLPDKVELNSEFRKMIITGVKISENIQFFMVYIVLPRNRYSVTLQRSIPYKTINTPLLSKTISVTVQLMFRCKIVDTPLCGKTGSITVKNARFYVIFGKEKFDEMIKIETERDRFFIDFAQISTFCAVFVKQTSLFLCLKNAHFLDFVQNIFLKRRKRA